jgi:hypothetical protein
VAPLATAASTVASTSATYRLIVTGVPPIDTGPRMPRSGYSSDSMITPSPISSSAWPTLSAGPSGPPPMRMRSVAPNTSV